MAPGIDGQALKDAGAQLAAARKALEVQRLLRESNLSVIRPSEDELKQLDSSIKKNSALTKKLRQLTEDSKQAILDDIRKTNQSKYVSEAVGAIADAPLRASDVPAAVAVCSLLHQRYADFGEQIAPALAKAFPKAGAGAESGGAAAEREGAKRRRAALRLLGELLAAGVVTSASPLLTVLKDLALPDYKKDREGAITALTLLGSFARPARELLLGQQLPAAALAAEAAVPAELAQPGAADGLPADVAAALAELRGEQEALQTELEKRFVLPTAEAGVLSKVFDRAFEAAAAALGEDHKQLQEIEVENAALINTRGDLPAEAAAEYERRRKAYETLHRAVAALAEGLARDMPVAVAEDAFTRLGAGDSASKDAAAKDAGGRDAAADAGAAPEHAFEDPDVRAFYESLPEVRELVPSLLLFGPDGKDPRAVAAAAKEAAAKEQPAAAAAAKDGEDAAGAAASAAGDGTTAPAAAPGTAEDAAAAGTSGSAATEAPAEEEKPFAAGAGDAEGRRGSADGEGDGDGGAAGGGAEGGGGSQALDLVLSKLSTCVSRDLADELAINFCYCNSKGNRKRLVRALVDVPRASLQLIPFFARVVAVLATVFPDVPQGVLSALESQFGALLRRKDPSLSAASLEPRLRTARYLAELAKFRLLPPGSFFSALKQLLDDFTGHNIDTACALVEGAGRFMYRSAETRQRMENMMEVMMRLKNARNLDQRQGALVESAYWAVKPPSKGTQRRKRSPLHEYIRHLIFDVLAESTIPTVLRKLLKLPWAAHEQYVVKCLLKVVRGRYSNIPLVSCLAAGLAQYHDSVGVALVDCVLEDIRLGLETPGAGLYQKRMADVRLLGELYNYMLCNSTPVFETLYLLVTFGHESPELAERLDPPDDFFRVRLVCALLDACGQYFSEGAARARLDRFLTFFQAYILSKAAMPLDVEFDLQDVLHMLRPQLRRFDTYEAALTAVNDIIAAEVARFGAPLGTIGEEEGDEEDERRGGGGGGREDETEDDATGGVAGDARSLGEMSGRSSEDEAEDEVDADFEREWAALMGDTQSRLGGLSLAGGGGGGSGATPAAAGASAAGAGAAGAGVAAAASGAAAGEHMHHGSGLHRHHHHPHHGLYGDDESGGGSVTLKMLVKRGGKDDRTRELQVPLSSAVAMALRQREEEEAREREEMKRLVLAANRAQQEEQLASLQQQNVGRPGGGGKKGSGYRYPKHTGQLDISVLDDFGPAYDLPFERAAPPPAPAQQQVPASGGRGGGYGGRGGYSGRGRGPREFGS